MSTADRVRDLIRSHRRAFAGAIVAVAIILWTAVGVAVYLVRDVLTGLPDKDALRAVSTMAQSTTLLDMHDRPAFTIYREQRIDVPLSGVSRHFVRAILAVEDQRFYEHGGVDVVRMAGAALTNLREGRKVQGGSTITQQLARQSFLTPDKTFRRKIKEVIVASRLEHEFSKHEILQLYLNKVYFGDGLYGVEAASLGFFGKHAADLDVPEAALLAGLLKSPSSYAPTISSERAIARRNVVLQAMRHAGAIEQATYDAALEAPLALLDALRNEEGFGQYFKEEVRKQLVERFGWDRVYQGGLRVYTTLDMVMQKVAEVEVAHSLEDLEKRQARQRAKRPGRHDGSRDHADPLQAALVAIEPTSGEVRAMVGGRDFGRSRFNRAVQARRQPGSAFKPFVYAAALERGFNPATLITNLEVPVSTLQGAWTPDDEHLATSAMTMRTALRTSSNRAAVRMLEQVGIPETVRHAERLGVGLMPSVPSLALGSGEVTLLAMTAAYAAFANRGLLLAPSLIRRVETTGGELLYDNGQRPQRAVAESTAFMLTSMMADVVNAGTGWQARRVGFTLPAAGKTGTTNAYNDAWFVGYTPKLVTGVWVGYDQPRTIITNGYAGDVAVPLWGRFMKAATSGDEPDWFRPPPGVTSATICRISGKLAVDGCRITWVMAGDGSLSQRSQAYTEYFVRGTEPIEECAHHTSPAFPNLVVGTTGEAPALDPVATGGDPQGLLPASAMTVPPAPEAETPSALRRGFWSRFFGRGENEKKPARPPRPPGGR